MAQKSVIFVLQKCVSPDDYIGVDTTLGMCRCKTDELSEICDEECIENQKDRLTLHCPEPPLEPFIRITATDPNGNKNIVVSASNEKHDCILAV
jgi:hypothetical protein